MTLSDARKILGKSSNKFSDIEIEYLINQFYEIADVVTEIIGSKTTTKGIELSDRKVDYD